MSEKHFGHVITMTYPLYERAERGTYSVDIAHFPGCSGGEAQLT